MVTKKVGEEEKEDPLLKPPGISLQELFQKLRTERKQKIKRKVADELAMAVKLNTGNS